jgi:hypothetical protein
VTDEFAAVAWAKTLPLAGAAMVGDIPIRANPKAMRVAMTAIFIVFSFYSSAIVRRKLLPDQFSGISRPFGQDGASASVVA